MAGQKGVVFAFLVFGEPGEAPFLPQGGEPVPPAGEQFVGIALMPHIPNDLVMGTLKHPVEGHSQFHGAQVGCQMPSGP